MSAEQDYNDLGPGEIDTAIIRRYVSGGNVPTAGLVLSLCAHIDALDRSDLVIADLETELRAAVADLHAAEGRAARGEAELAALQAQRDATLEQEVSAILDAMSVVEVEQGQARVNDTLIPALARMMALLLVKPDGELYNVMEWSIGSDPDIGELRLFMQRVEGKTISDLYHEMRAARDLARADAEMRRAAIERYLDLDGQCDYVDGEPDVCPGVAERGHPCHWCELRAAVRGGAGAPLLAERTAAWAERDYLRTSLNMAEELICALYDGATQHGDTAILDAIEIYYAAVMDSLPPPAPEDRARVERVVARVIARIKDGAL